MTDQESADRGVPSLEPVELARRIESGAPVTVVDVRDRDEFAAWHVDGDGVEAAQIPLNRFVAADVRGETAALVEELAEPIVVVCAEGEASAEVAEILRSAGVDAKNLAGGMDGWARFLRVTELARPGATVRQYHRPASGCLSYLVASDGAAAVIDPLRAFTDRYLDDVDDLGVDLRWAIDTHVHADHVSGAREISGATDATIVLPEGATGRGLDYEAETVADGANLSVGGETLAAIHAPGHTPEMTAFALGVDGDPEGTDAGEAETAPGGILFAGDSLFLSGVARPDLAVDDGDDVESMARELHATLHDRLESVPTETRVAPGHVAAGVDADGSGAHVATLGDLRERLPTLGLAEDEFVERVTGDLGEQPANYEEIIAANLGQRSLDDEAAFELELGPNNCAAG